MWKPRGKGLEAPLRPKMTPKGRGWKGGRRVNINAVTHAEAKEKKGTGQRMQKKWGHTAKPGNRLEATRLDKGMKKKRGFGLLGKKVGAKGGGGKISQA